jgi:hypothetical protein
MCSGSATAPRCEGNITPPTCQGNADCQASCNANAKLEAECKPPSVEFVATGTVDAAFVTALEANVGVFAKVAGKAQIIGNTAVDIANQFSAVVSGSAACAASASAEIKAALEASVSIKASVDVSASASGTASTGK